MEEISLDNKGQDDYLDTCEGKFLRNLMTQKIDSNIYEPRCCRDCKYHRPNWDFRSCKFSYLEEKMQKLLYEYIKDNGVIKSYQISALRDELNMNGNLSRNEVIQILKDYQMGRKPAMRINFTSNQLRKYFSAYYSSQEAKAVIEKLLGKWKKEQDKKNQEGDK